MKRAIDKMSIWWTNHKNGIHMMSDAEYAAWQANHPNPVTIEI